MEEIIHKPMEEFNDILSKHSVSEEIINICRDIRRRGKNKVSLETDVSIKLNVLFRSLHKIVAREKLIRFSVSRMTYQ